MNIREAVNHARACVANDPGLAMSFLRGYPEVRNAGLEDLVWLLAAGKCGCSKNDALAVLEDLEAWLTGPPK